MVRLCGAALGLFAFSITVLLGLFAGNPTNVVLLKALQAMLAFCVLGMCAGWVAYRVLDEHALRKHREMFPSEVQPAKPNGETPDGLDSQGKPAQRG